MERRLAAILAADMVGFSARMEVDQEGTLKRLRAARIDIIEPEVAAHHGWIFKNTGDGFLAEFPSAIEALNCAVNIQRAVGQANAGRDDLHRTDFRMGMNVGDVIVEDGDVYGDGVNIAARLEPLAPAGGIVVPDAVRGHLQNKVSVVFEPMGERRLKNISEPVSLFRVAADLPDAGASGDLHRLQAPQNLLPMLAVLPFDNMSRDADQDHLSDGLTEDLITTLSKIGQLSVVSRNSVFTYKGRTVTPGEVRLDLNADFVLSGSVRQAGDRLRINAQLTDAKSGEQLWAERFDRVIDDLFAVQDEITLTIATALQVELTDGEQAKLRYTTTDNVDAWVAFTQGLSHFRDVSAESYRQARAHFERALQLDPGSAQIHAMLACTHAIEGRFFWTAERDVSLEQAKVHADRALARDPDCADAHAALGYWHMCLGRLEDSIAAYGRAVALSPDHADLRALYALALTFAERPQEAITQAQMAIRLNPLDPGWYCGVLGHAYRYAGRTEDAVDVLADYNRRSPGFGLVDLVLAHADAGDLPAARKSAQALLAARPDFNIEDWSRTQNVHDPERLATDRASLKEAGLP